jgi:Fe-S-cluster containining protein
MASTAVAPDLDLALVSRFRYACRPECGLCCYAEPRVLASERARLLQIRPETEFVRRGEFQFLASHPDGGACKLLTDRRCSAHTARPHPCREFPLTIHVGDRLQATVVLSCPGVDLAGLQGAPVSSRSGPEGFDSELAAVRARIEPSTARRMDVSRRRRQRIVRLLDNSGRWEEEEDVRRLLRDSIPLPADEDFPALEPPSEDDGMDRLPLFFDGRAGPVALSAGLGGWELHELSPNGGFVRSLGVVPPPEEPPPLTSDASELLVGYLRYWLERDAFFGALHYDMLEGADGTVSEWAAEELRSIGAVTLARAELRAKIARGEVDRLTPVDVANGIRATDQDLLDRESWGERL